MLKVDGIENGLPSGAAILRACEIVRNRRMMEALA
jgi:hypothetical protein